MPALPPFDEHLILNTHWDREWRWSFRETQVRLVQALDLLLETMERDPRFRAFHTDSQVSPIDDYLEMRPENEGRVRELVECGRLLIGPWYTLPAHFLVSGEALVRNLLLGHRLSRRYGGVMKVAYNIFSWGQISQLPQIYRQFGMETILFYRGVDQSALEKLEFWWEAPDGKRSLGVTFGSQHRLNFWAFVYRPYLAGGNKAMMDRAEGRGFLVNLADPYSRDGNHWMLDQISARDTSGLVANMNRLADTVRLKSSTSHLLFFQGFDLENPDPAVPDLVEGVNRACGAEHRLHVSTLPEFVRLHREALETGGHLGGLPVLKGEMLAVERVNASFGDLFAQVFSARIPIKLANSAAEVRLERWAEPASVWAWLWGAPYPTAPLRVAWKELLKNQQHDGIGGAHNDRVSETMAERYRDVRDIAETASRGALMHLVARIDCSSVGEKEIALIVFNSDLHPRPAIVEAVVDVPAAYLGGDAVYSQLGGMLSKRQLVVRDSAGRKRDVQIADQWDEVVFTYRKFGAHYPQTMRRFRVFFDAATVPACGFSGFVASVDDGLERPSSTLAPEVNCLENDRLRVRVHGDGSFDLMDKRRGRTYEGLHVFLDEAEMGNPLVHVVPADEGALSSSGQPATISLVRAGTLSATLRIEREWALPERLEVPARVWPAQVGEWVEAGRPKRSQRRAVMRICTELTLERGLDLLTCRTTVDNTVRDHRLRLLFRTGLDAKESVADSPFDVVRRPVAVPATSGWREAPLRQWPASSWVDVSDGRYGLALLHRWVAEYELIDNRRGDLALTLLRCFSAPGGLGETYEAQELAQCQGSHTFEYSLYPHAGDWVAGDVPRVASAFRAPLRVAQTTRHSGPRSLSGGSFLRLENGGGILMTALKRAEEEDLVVMRLVSVVAEQTEAVLVCDFPVIRAQQLTLEEVPVRELDVDASRRRVSFVIRRGEILTLGIAFEAVAENDRT